jgi:hypothetical protein
LGDGQDFELRRTYRGKEFTTEARRTQRKWKDGRMEEWKSGRVEEWNGGSMENWNVEALAEIPLRREKNVAI